MLNGLKESIDNSLKTPRLKAFRDPVKVNGKTKGSMKNFLKKSAFKELEVSMK